MNNDIKKVFFSEEEINNIISKLGEKLTADFKDKKPLVIGLLNGCNPFMTDLVKKIQAYLTLDYMKVSSYVGTESTNNLVIEGKIPDVKDKEVILVDDILDTGRTLKTIKEKLLALGAKSVSLCVLLDKPEGRKFDIQADYVGDLVPNEFVVGYGLDYNGYYRNLPYIGVLKEEVYTK